MPLGAFGGQRGSTPVVPPAPPLPLVPTTPPVLLPPLPALPPAVVPAVLVLPPVPTVPPLALPPELWPAVLLPAEPPVVEVDPPLGLGFESSVLPPQATAQSATSSEQLRYLDMGICK